MPYTATPPIDLAQLEQLYQRHLQADFPQLAPIQMHCYLRDDTLAILVEHGQPVFPYPHRVFQRCEQILAATELPFEPERSLIYLRIEGQTQPYGFHIAKVKPSVAETEVEPTPNLTSYSDSESAALADAAWEAAEEEAEEDNTAIAKTPWLPMILVGTGFAGIIFFTSLYLLSRPCVLRECEEIPYAKELTTDALSTLAAPESGREILKAQWQFQKATDLLEEIPFWSNRHTEAQNLLAVYQETELELDRLVEALQTGVRASYLTQNRPVSAAKWLEAVEHWQNAIALLAAIDSQNQFYDFAQTKLPEYRRNLRAVKQGLEKEGNADTSLAIAQEKAKTAAVRQEIAQNLENLRLAENLWQSAIASLRQIPQETAAYSEARATLTTYNTELGVLRDRLNRENFSNRAYNEALRFATDAKAAENRNQWSQAVINWRSALNAIEEVQDDTFDYGKAQPLVETYRNALNNAENQLKNAVIIQQARNDLNRLCGQNGDKVCHYTLSDKLLKVTLTPTYIQKVRSTAFEAQSAGDVNAQVKILDHVYTLERALETVSQNLNVRLEVYTSNNVLVQTFIPGTNR
ncbi:MAG: hypothetical protein SAJ12_02720 [Jaaginema sp. PMC 1079.18]|nr:hypothetical protein [Jaaginema sp. PMC 1080.18]MEC4849900.1 hypothetical protein [Jaaginema sp. PMC 1079.18]MEC4865987.1 hypothetical protein [Jaaginema sp. PMC 1078.18]